MFNHEINTGTISIINTNNTNNTTGVYDCDRYGSGTVLNMHNLPDESKKMIRMPVYHQAVWRFECSYMAVKEAIIKISSVAEFNKLLSQMSFNEFSVMSAFVEENVSSTLLLDITRNALSCFFNEHRACRFMFNDTNPEGIQTDTNVVLIFPYGIYGVCRVYREAKHICDLTHDKNDDAHVGIGEICHIRIHFGSYRQISCFEVTKSTCGTRTVYNYIGSYV